MQISILYEQIMLCLYENGPGSVSFLYCSNILCDHVNIEDILNARKTKIL